MYGGGGHEVLWAIKCFAMVQFLEWEGEGD